MSFPGILKFMILFKILAKNHVSYVLQVNRWYFHYTYHTIQIKHEATDFFYKKKLKWNLFLGVISQTSLYIKIVGKDFIKETNIIKNKINKKFGKIRSVHCFILFHYFSWYFRWIIKIYLEYFFFKGWTRMYTTFKEEEQNAYKL